MQEALPIQSQPRAPRGPGRLSRLWHALGARGQLGIILGLTTLVVAVAGLQVFYVVTRKPVTELPAVQNITRPIPPRRIFSVADVTMPVGVAVSQDGRRVFVAEGGGERYIKVFDRDGRLVGQTAPPQTQPGNRKPSFMAVDSDGRLFVLDRSRTAIDVYSPNLEWERAWTPPVVADLGGWLPNGVTIGPNGRIYVTEIGQAEHRVLVFDHEGSLVDTLGKHNGITDGLNYPVLAAADEAGRVYISDASNGRVIALGSRGMQTVGVVGDQAVALPMGLTVGSQKLFVADAAAHRIAVFGLGDRPEFLYAFGDSDDDDGLAYPHAVAVDGTGRVYIADRANHRVQVWTY